MYRKTSLILLLTGYLLARAQTSAPTPNPTQDRLETPTTGTPIFRVEVVSRTTQAINYRHRGGATRVNLKGTTLMPAATGQAKVESERGVIHISAELKN